MTAMTNQSIKTLAILGAGSVGAALGKIWAQGNHQVILTFGRDVQKIEAAARAAGPRARTASSPAEAVAAADVVVLAVPWNAVDSAIQQAGSLQGKILLTVANPLLPDMSGLLLGTTTSGAEEIAKKSPGALVVEAIPPFAEVLTSSARRFGNVQPSTFYCGDDATAKSHVAQLLQELDVQPVDAGPLRNARFIEPANVLLMQIQYGGAAQGQYGLRLLHR